MGCIRMFMAPAAPSTFQEVIERLVNTIFPRESFARDFKALPRTADSMAPPLLDGESVSCRDYPRVHPVFHKV
jgi:hypothetical protein